MGYVLAFGIIAAFVVIVAAVSITSARRADGPKGSGSGGTRASRSDDRDATPH